MDKRIFVEKKANFQVKSESLVKELTHNLQLQTLKAVRILQVYDVFNLSEDLFARAEKHIFSEQVTDNVLTEAAVRAELDNYAFFAIEALPGQFDQRAASSQEALLLLGGASDVVVNKAQLYLVNKDIAAEELVAVKNYLLNPVDSRFKDITVAIAPQEFSTSDKTIPNLDFFATYTAEEFAAYKAEVGMAMEVDDLLFIQDYFKSIGRVPTETELKVLDTYWSDHCRHTTFETELKSINFSESQFEAQLQATYEKYLAMREELGRSEKPQTLMDMATVFGRYERANGRLDDMEVSDEINACSVEIEVDVNGVKEPWLLMFKNETHNHPTEIEPFGGAATCIGGAIRDPLSGRAYVYQAMRISGAGDITAPIAATRKGKLPQQVISKTAAHGYSSYGNQIGLATTYVREYFHPGFVAKRMELGAVVGAAPKENVVREKPVAGDVVILLGGKTGRDGVGGATGSSKVQTVESVETAGAEVQKGNAIEERKIQRLFRDGNVTRLIKKSNDFGARGGLIIGICNGFQALVKSGLLPYGNFEDATASSPTLFYNDANQHVAKMVETRIANTNSPWLAGVSAGDIHAIPVSHGEGKFVVTEAEFAELRDNGQIWSQYVDFDGQPSMDSKYNPNGSVYAIEGITSKNGQIIGKMGHSERYEEGLFQNIPGQKDQRLFESAVKYFTGK